MPPIIFLGTTTPELQECRQKVLETLAKFLRESIVLNDKGWDGILARDEHVANIQVCDFFVCILGYCYGDQFQEGGKSVVEIEYDFARQQQRRCLVYEAADNFLIPAHLHERDDRWQKQEELRRRIHSTCDPQRFVHTAELAFNLVRTIQDWESGSTPYEYPIVTENLPDIGKNYLPLSSPAKTDFLPLTPLLRQELVDESQSPPLTALRPIDLSGAAEANCRIALISLDEMGISSWVSELFRAIEQALDGSERRSHFFREQHRAARLMDLLRYLEPISKPALSVKCRHDPNDETDTNTVRRRCQLGTVG